MAKVTHEMRKTIYEMWRTGASKKDISEHLKLNVNTIRNELCKGYNGQIYPGGRPVYDPELAERCSNSHGRQAHREQMMRMVSAPPSICPGDDMGEASAQDD